MVSTVVPANYENNQPDKEKSHPCRLVCNGREAAIFQTNNCLRSRAETSRCTLQTRKANVLFKSIGIPSPQKTNLGFGIATLGGVGGCPDAKAMTLISVWVKVTVYDKNGKFTIFFPEK